VRSRTETQIDLQRGDDAHPHHLDTTMSTFHEPRARARRAHRSWLWFWCVLGALLVVLALTIARDVATVLVAGFLTHSHS
jgi:hypothetical protein